MKIVSWNVRGLGNPIKKKVTVKGALRRPEGGRYCSYSGIKAFFGGRCYNKGGVESESVWLDFF